MGVKKKRKKFYHQNSPFQNLKTGYVGRCLQTAFSLRMRCLLPHLHAPEPRWRKKVTRKMRMAAQGGPQSSLNVVASEKRT